MPRLSNTHYIHAHHQLRYFWLHNQIVYGYLRPDQQLLLHAFYRPADDLTQDELLAHRRAITRKRSTLPHAAGRALSQFRRMAAEHGLRVVRERRQVGASAGGKRTIRCDSPVIALPAIDPHMSDEGLARIVAAMVLHNERQQIRDERDAA